MKTKHAISSKAVVLLLFFIVCGCSICFLFVCFLFFVVVFLLLFFFFWGGGGGGWVFGSCFVLQYFVSFLVLQSSYLGREIWLLDFCCALNVMSLLSFFDSSPRCHG